MLSKRKELEKVRCPYQLEVSHEFQNRKISLPIYWEIQGLVLNMFGVGGRGVKTSHNEGIGLQ